MESVTNESHVPLPSEEAVFRALADPTRRAILDRLFARAGQTLGEIERAFEMSRFGVMKHLRILEGAALVTTHKHGRQKLHYLNAVPIVELQERWIHKFAADASAALLGLRAELERGASMAAIDTSATGDVVEMDAKPSHVFAIWIRATPELVWEALTSSAYTRQYYFASTVDSDFRPGSPIVYRIGDDAAIVGEVLECDPATRLVCSFDARWDDEVRHDPPSRIAWTLEQAGDGVTKLTVVHDRFSERTATYNQVGEGMSYILSGLKTLLETGKPMMAGRG